MEIDHKIGISKWKIWKKKKRLKVCNFNAVRLSQLYPQETTKNKNAQNMKKRMQKCESVKMQNYENLKTGSHPYPQETTPESWLPHMNGPVKKT